MTTMKPHPDRDVDQGLRFLYSLRKDPAESEYYEVKGKWEQQHQVFKQTQYLVSILFKKIGWDDLSQKIRSINRPEDEDNDPPRKGHRAGDRWCVLEGRTDLFDPQLVRHAREGVTEGKGNDEIALMALYCILKAEGLPPHPLAKSFRQNAEILWNTVKKRYDPSKGVLEMDKADRENNSHSVYKVALLGILAKRMNDTETLESVRRNLRSWRDKPTGGWQTERTLQLKPGGLINAETTAMALLALADC